MAPGDQQQQQPQLPDPNSPEARERAQKEGAAEKKEDLRAETLSSLQANAKTEVTKSAAELASSGQKDVEGPVISHLQTYFQGNIDRFDADKDGRISRPEADAFRDKMMAKTRELLGGLKKGAEEQKKTAEAVSKVEALSAKEVSDNLNSVKDLPENAGYQESMQQLQAIQMQNTAFQQSVGEQISSIREFGASYQKFQEQQSGWHAWGQVWDAVFNSSKRDQWIAEMNGKLESTKAAANQALSQLEAKNKILTANGQKIQKAIAAERAKAIETRDRQAAEIEAQKGKMGKEVDEKKAKYGELEKAKQGMEGRKKEIIEKQAKNADLKKAWQGTKEEENLNLKQQEYQSSRGEIEEQVKAYELILNDPNVPKEAKDQIQPEYQKALKNQKDVNTGLQVIDLKQKRGQQVDVQMDQGQQAAAKELETAEGHLRRQGETLTSLGTNIQRMEELQLQYATESEQVNTYYNGKVTELDKLSEDISGYVLDSAMGRNQAIGVLRTATESINNLKVEVNSAWNPLNLVQGTFSGVAGWFSDFGKWIDGGMHNAAQESSGVTHVLVQVGQFFTGIVSGASEMVGGLFTMVAHPLDTLKGLGTLVGIDANEGTWTVKTLGEGWKNLFKTLFAFEDFEKGDVGTGLGKIGINVASMFIGVGEVGGAAKVGAAAAKVGSVAAAKTAAAAARIAAIDAAKAAALAGGKVAAGTAVKVGRFTGVGAATWAFAKTLVTEMKPQFAVRAGEDAAVAARLGENATWAATKSVASSAWSGVKAIPSATKNFVVDTLPKAAKSAVKSSAKMAGDLVMFPPKVLYNTGKTIYKLARDGFRPGTSEAVQKAARVSKATRALEEATENGRYVEARQRIDEVISKDTAKGGLAERAAAIDQQIAKTPQINLSEHSRLAMERASVEAEAASRLASTAEGAALADSYVKVRQGSEVLQKEMDDLAAAAGKEAEAVTSNQRYKVDFEEHEALRTQRNSAQHELDRLKKDPASDPALLQQAEQKLQQAQQQLQAFPPERTSNARQYRAAREQIDQIAEIQKQRAALNDQYLASPHQSPDIARLDSDILEARRATATDSRIGTSYSNTPKFAEEFVKKYEQALAAGDDLARQQLIRDSLGGVHHGGPLEEVLEGLKLKSERKIPREPEMPAEFLAQRDKVMNMMEHNLGTGRELEVLDRLKKTPQYANAAQYLDWMQDVYLRPGISPADARSIIRTDAATFRKALLDNHKTSIAKVDQYRQLLAEGDRARIEQFTKECPESWGKALEQIRERNTFINRNKELAHQMSAQKIKAELPQVITDSLTTREAADAVAKRYSRETSPTTGTGRLEMETRTLQQGQCKVVLMPDGEVRIFNAQNELIPTGKEAAKLQKNLKIKKTTKAEELADNLYGKKVDRPASLPGGDPVFIADDLVLENGQKYSLKLSADNELQLFDSTGTQVRGPKAQAAPAPAPTAAPTAAPAAVPSSPLVKQYEQTRATIQSHVENDPRLKAISEKSDAGARLAEAHAEVKINLDRNERVYEKLLEREKAAAEKLQKTPNTAAREFKAAQDELQKAADARVEFEKKLSTERQFAQELDQHLQTIESNPQGLGAAEIEKFHKDRFNTSLRRRLESQSADDVAEMLAREKPLAVAGQKGSLELGELKLKDKQTYKVRLTEEGQYELINESGVLHTAPSAAAVPAAAPAGGRLNRAYERVKGAREAAVQKIEQAKKAFRNNPDRIIEMEKRKMQLEKDLESAQKTDPNSPAARSYQQQLDDLTLEQEALLKELGTAREGIWGARYDRMANRFKQNGLGAAKKIVDGYTGVQNRLEKMSGRLASASRTVWDIAKAPFEGLRNAYNGQWTIARSPANLFKITLAAQVGKQVAEQLEKVHEVAGDQPDIAADLQQLAQEQYEILHGLTEGEDPSIIGLPAPDQFTALSAKDKIAVLNSAYSQLRGIDSLTSGATAAPSPAPAAGSDRQPGPAK